MSAGKGWGTTASNRKILTMINALLVCLYSCEICVADIQHSVGLQTTSFRKTSIATASHILGKLHVSSKVFDVRSYLIVKEGAQMFWNESCMKGL